MEQNSKFKLAREFDMIVGRIDLEVNISNMVGVQVHENENFQVIPSFSPVIFTNKLSKKKKKRVNFINTRECIPKFKLLHFKANVEYCSPHWSLLTFRLLLFICYFIFNLYILI